MKASPILLLLLSLGLAACEPPGQPEAKRNGPPPETLQPPAPPPVETAGQVASLAGAWRVAGIDGRSFDEPTGLSLTGDDRQLWWEPRCAGVARAYRIEGQRITFVSIKPAGSPGAPVCDIGLPPRLDEVVRALDNAVSVSRTPNNGVLISGAGHSILLFSQ